MAECAYPSVKTDQCSFEHDLAARPRLEIAATGGRVIAIQADVADADAVARMAVRTEAEFGPVSILVNNAGVSSPATLESYDPAAMACMRRVNVDGVIHTIRAVATGVRKRGYGRIINIASNAAIGTTLPGTTFTRRARRRS